LETNNEHPTSTSKEASERAQDRKL